MLVSILRVVGFLLLILGAGGMDSEMLFTPVVMVLIGLACLLWASKESGNIRKPR